MNNGGELVFFIVRNGELLQVKRHRLEVVGGGASPSFGADGGGIFSEKVGTLLMDRRRSISRCRHNESEGLTPMIRAMKFKKEV